MIREIKQLNLIPGLDHSPGPWERTVHGVIDKNGRVIVPVRNVRPLEAEEEKEKNANLEIIAAAPEFSQMAQLVLEFFSMEDRTSYEALGLQSRIEKIAAFALDKMEGKKDWRGSYTGDTDGNDIPSWLID